MVYFAEWSIDPSAFFMFLSNIIAKWDTKDLEKSMIATLSLTL
jgi:hypothetical protein